MIILRLHLLYFFLFFPVLMVNQPVGCNSIGGTSHLLLLPSVVCFLNLTKALRSLWFLYAVNCNNYCLISPGICSACYFPGRSVGLVSVASATYYISLCVQFVNCCDDGAGWLVPSAPDLLVFCHIPWQSPPSPMA